VDQIPHHQRVLVSVRKAPKQLIVTYLQACSQPLDLRLHILEAVIEFFQSREQWGRHTDFLSQLVATGRHAT
jgi:hypothetical protein